MQPVISNFPGVAFPVVIVATDLERINGLLYSLLKSCDDTQEVPDVPLYQLETFCLGASDFLDNVVIGKVFEDFEVYKSIRNRKRKRFLSQCSSVKTRDPNFYALLTRNNLEKEVFYKLHYVLVRLHNEIAKISAKKRKKVSH